MLIRDRLLTDNFEQTTTDNGLLTTNYESNVHYRRRTLQQIDIDDIRPGINIPANVVERYISGAFKTQKV